MLRWLWRKSPEEQIAECRVELYKLDGRVDDLQKQIKKHDGLLRKFDDDVIRIDDNIKKLGRTVADAEGRCKHRANKVADQLDQRIHELAKELSSLRDYTKRLHDEWAVPVTEYINKRAGREQVQPPACLPESVKVPNGT